MEYPVYIGGQASGTLRERQDGLYTVWEIDCAPREGLIRLWAQGGGRSVCLGLLAPEGGRLRLIKRLSRREREKFPSLIERISDQTELFIVPGEAAAPPPETEKPALESSAAPEEVSAPKTPPPPGVPEPENPAKQPQTPSPWQRLSDGSLVAPDGAIALPAKLPPDTPLAPLLQQIDGQDYLVFRL